MIINDLKIKTFSVHRPGGIFQGLPVHDYRAVCQPKGTPPPIQKQTDVSALVRNPLFITNSMIFDLSSNLTLQGTVIVTPI
jgi:hypothetical protein